MPEYQPRPFDPYAEADYNVEAARDRAHMEYDKVVDEMRAASFDRVYAESVVDEAWAVR